MDYIWAWKQLNFWENLNFLLFVEGQEKIAVISLWWSQMKGHLQISVQEVKYMLLAVSNLGHLTTFARVTLELNKPKSCLLDVFYLRLNDDISPVVPRPVVTLSK